MPALPVIKLSKGIHERIPVIGIKFPYNRALAGVTPYSTTCIYSVVKNAARKAGIKKRIYPNILRPSFATPHLEQGVDIRFIQEWLNF